jgi:C-terminal processing protease CtpA/Prc
MTRRFLSLIVFASWLAGGSLLRAEATNTALVKASVLENNVAYLRIGQVTKNLGREFDVAFQTLTATNKIAGVVLDLRFAGGDDMSTVQSNLFALKMPLMILVNRETRGAATMLAYSARVVRAALIFGNTTAPFKSDYGETPGVTPDIAVAVKIADEKKYLQNPYAALAQSETNAAATNHIGTFIDHTTEADLVREKIKDGDQDEDSMPPRPTEPQKPFIHDPALARAVDLIHALAVIHPSHG